MKTKLVSLLKMAGIVVCLCFSSNALAEYYLVYSASGPTECSSCVKRAEYRPCYHRYIHHKKKRHYVRYAPHRPRSSYSISVYYYGMVAPCCQSCAAPRCCGGCTFIQPVDNFVTYSGEPSRYSYYVNGTANSDYYQDQRTADDIYGDMNINN